MVRGKKSDRNVRFVGRFINKIDEFEHVRSIIIVRENRGIVDDVASRIRCYGYEVVRSDRSVEVIKNTVKNKNKIF